MMGDPTNSSGVLLDYEGSLDEVPDTSQSRPFAVASALIGAALVTIMLVCGVGNCVFIAGLLRFKRLRNRTNVLMANLAVSDALVAALCCPFLLDYYVVKKLSWNHGLLLCAATNYLRTVSLHVSTNALLAIAVDRYSAILHPLKPRMTHQAASCVVLAVWLVPAFISIPSAYMTSETTYPHAEGRSHKTFCAQIWPAEQQLYYRSYFLLVFLLEFVGPVGAMAVCYTGICRRLWSNSVPGEQTEQIRRRHHRRRRTVTVLILVLAAYVLCWAPYYAFALLRDFYPALILRGRNSLVAFYVIESVAMSNGVVNTLCFLSVQRSARRPRTAGAAPLRQLSWAARTSMDEGGMCSPRGMGEVDAPPSL